MTSQARRAAVLVVEDHDPTRTHMAELLQGRGYDVTEAVDGLDALKKVSHGQFDAILLDLALPHVDGWQFRATQMRHSELASIPTVIVTVRPLRHPERYALRAADIVVKPFEDTALVSAVERACRLPHPAGAPPSTVSSRALFWSRRGEIACGEHAPEATSPQWAEDRWAPIPDGAGRDRVTYQCQHCAMNGSPIAHQRRVRPDAGG